MLGSILGGLGRTVLDDAVINVGVNTSQVRQGMAQATRDIQRSAGGWNKAFLAAGAAVTALTGTAVAFGGAAVKASMDFNTALAPVYSMTGATREEMAFLREEVLKLASAVGVGPTKLAEALYFIKSAGFDGATAMSLLEHAAKAAVAGQADVIEVADGLTSVMKAYNLGAEEAERVTDVLTLAIRDGKFEWDELARSVGKHAAIAAQSGVQLEEYAAALAMMSQLGLSAADSGNQLRAMFRSLTQPTERAWKTFKALGYEYDTTKVATQGLLPTLQELEGLIGQVADGTVLNKDGTVNLIKTQEKWERLNRGVNSRWRDLLGSTQAVMAAQILLTDEGARYTETLNAMNEAQGETNESFNRLREMDLGAMFEATGATIEATMIRIGDKLQPLFMGLFSIINTDMPNALTGVLEMIERFGELWDKHMAGPVGRLGEALGGLLGAIGDILFNWSLFTDESGEALTMAEISERIAGAFGAMVDALANIVGFFAEIFSNPVVQNAGKLALALAAMNVALQAMKGIRGLFSGLGNLTLRAITFGKMGGPANLQDPGTLAMQQAAGHHVGAAKALTSAASALTAAATGSVLRGERPTITGPRGGMRAATDAEWAEIERQKRLASAERQRAARAIDPAWSTPPRQKVLEGFEYVPRQLASGGTVMQQQPVTRELPPALPWNTAQANAALQTGRAVPIDLRNLSDDVQEAFDERVTGLADEVWMGVDRGLESYGDATRKIARDVAGDFETAAVNETRKSAQGTRGRVARFASEFGRGFGRVFQTLARTPSALAELDRPFMDFGKRILQRAGQNLQEAFRRPSQLLQTLPNQDSRPEMRYDRASYGRILNAAIGDTVRQANAAFQTRARSIFRPLVEGVTGGVTGAFSGLKAGGSWARALPGVLGNTLANEWGRISTEAVNGREFLRSLPQRMGQAKQGFANAMVMATNSMFDHLASSTQGSGISGSRQQLLSQTGRQWASRTFAQMNAGLLRGAQGALSAIRAAPGAYRELATGAGAFARGAAGATMRHIGSSLLAIPQSFIATGRGMGSLASGAARLTKLTASTIAGNLVNAWAGPQMTRTILTEVNGQIRPLVDEQGNAIRQTIRSGGIRGALSTGLRTVSNLFWPAMIGMMVGELVAAPIGQYVSDQLGAKNFGAEIQKNWIGAIGTLITSWATGADLETISNLETDKFQVGSVTIDRAKAASMGFSHAEMADLFVENATFSQRLFQIRVAEGAFKSDLAKIEGIGGVPEMPEIDFSGLSNITRSKTFDLPDDPLREVWLKWTTDLRTIAENNQIDLDALVQEGLDMGLTDKGAWRRAAQTIERTLTEKWETDIATFRADLGAYLETLGIDPTIAGLADETQLRGLAGLASQNVNGELDALIQTYANQVLKGITDHTPTLVPLPEHEIPPTRFPTEGTAGGGLSPAQVSGVVGQFTVGRVLATDTAAEQDVATIARMELARVDDAIQDWLKGRIETTTMAQWLGMPNWETATKEEVDAILAGWRKAAGEADFAGLMDVVSQYAAEQAARGVDFQTTEIGRILMDWVNDNKSSMTPAMQRMWDEIFAGSFTPAGARLVENARGNAREMLEAVVTELAGGDEELAEQLTDTLEAAWNQTASEEYPSAGAAATALMEAFIDGLPDGPLKTELQTILEGSMATAELLTEPGLQTTSQQYMEAFINALPDKYESLKQQLIELLRDGAEAAGADPGVTSASSAAGIAVVDYATRALKGEEQRSKVRDVLVALLEGSANGAIPQEGSALWNTLWNMGSSLWLAVIAGINQSQYNPALAMANRLKHGLKDEGIFPDSPVKRGPLKHPLLPNIGKEIMGQLNSGIKQSNLDFSHLSADVSQIKTAGSIRANLVADGANAAGTHQEMNVDKLYVNNAQDEQSLLARMRFMLPRN